MQTALLTENILDAAKTKRCKLEWLAALVASVVTLKPANGGQGKTGQREWPRPVLFTPPTPVGASLFLCANCAGRI
jgi:hypothetical protein